MANFDATTPQLKAVKRWFGGYISLDLDSVEPIISKKFQYQSFPESTELPKETKESHIKRLREGFSAVTKFEANFHEVIEAPGKVIFHVTNVFHTVLGTALSYDTLIIASLVEEDGELKIIGCKVFSDPRERSAYLAGTAEAAAYKASAS